MTKKGVATMLLYHGCSMNDIDSVMDNIKITPRGFYMTPDINIARGYGRVVCFEVGDFDCHIGTINKGNDNVQEDIASGIEYVLKNERHLVSFYKALEDVYNTGL